MDFSNFCGGLVIALCLDSLLVLLLCSCFRVCLLLVVYCFPDVRADVCQSLRKGKDSKMGNFTVSGMRYLWKKQQGKIKRGVVSILSCCLPFEDDLWRRVCPP